MVIKKTLAKLLNVIQRNIDNLKYHKDFDNSNDYINSHFKEIKDNRCFIIGTGPSLNKTNLSLLKNENLIGVNTLYNGLKKFDIKPKYWCMADQGILKSYYKQILGLDTTLFIAETAMRDFLKNKKKYLPYVKKQPLVLKDLGSMNIWNKFGKDITKGVYSGCTVVIQCIQIAYYLGFKEVYLLGCDCDYTKGHYFHGGTHDFVSGDPFEDKKQRNYLMGAYEICKKTFENDGKKIYNATVGGKLEVFERKSLEEIFNE